VKEKFLSFYRSAVGLGKTEVFLPQKKEKTNWDDGTLLHSKSKETVLTERKKQRTGSKENIENL